MTPCEELGYKVGDKFIVTGINLFSPSREHVYLKADDGSDSPLFSNGEASFHMSIKSVEKYQINYTKDWYMDNPKTEEEYHMLVEVFDKFGVKVYDAGVHKPYWPYITPFYDKLERCGSLVEKGEKVDLLGALMKLTRPVVTEQQKKINQLKQTIESLETQAREAKQQIEKLEKEMK